MNQQELQRKHTTDRRATTLIASKPSPVPSLQSKPKRSQIPTKWKVTRSHYSPAELPCTTSRPPPLPALRRFY